MAQNNYLSGKKRLLDFDTYCYYESNLFHLFFSTYVPLQMSIKGGLPTRNP